MCTQDASRAWGRKHSHPRPYGVHIATTVAKRHPWQTLCRWFVGTKQTIGVTSSTATLRNEKMLYIRNSFSDVSQTRNDGAPSMICLVGGKCLPEKNIAYANCSWPRKNACPFSSLICQFVTNVQICSSQRANYSLTIFPGQQLSKWNRLLQT